MARSSCAPLNESVKYYNILLLGKDITVGIDSFVVLSTVKFWLNLVEVSRFGNAALTVLFDDGDFRWIQHARSSWRQHHAGVCRTVCCAVLVMEESICLCWWTLCGFFVRWRELYKQKFAKSNLNTLTLVSSSSHVHFIWAKTKNQNKQIGWKIPNLFYCC